MKGAQWDVFFQTLSKKGTDFYESSYPIAVLAQVTERMQTKLFRGLGDA